MSKRRWIIAGLFVLGFSLIAGGNALMKGTQVDTGSVLMAIGVITLLVLILFIVCTPSSAARKGRAYSASMPDPKDF